MNRKGYFVLFVPAALALLFMLIGSAGQEFWYDEVYQLGLSGSEISFSEMLEKYTELKDYTPPLFAMLAYAWVRMVPFSFRWLLVLPELFTAGGIALTALAAGEFAGRRAGVLAGTLAMGSCTVFSACAFEYRAYGLYFFASALFFYGWILREKRSGRRYDVFYAAALLLLLYSHYYGSILVLVHFLTELSAAIREHRKDVRRIFFHLLPIVAAGVCFLPWLVLVFLNRKRSVTEFWIEPPTFCSVGNLIDYLCGRNVLGVILFAVGIVLCIVMAAREKTAWRKKFLISVPVQIAGVIVLMFVYGAWINPSGGIFYNRYFIGLLPFVFFVMTYGVCTLANSRSKPGKALVYGIVFISIAWNAHTLFIQVNEPQKISYQSAVETLSAKEDILSGDTALLVTDNDSVRDGIRQYFKEFYGICPEIISQYEDNAGAKLKQYDTIYVFYGKQSVTQETRDLLAGYSMTMRDKAHRIRKYQ